MADFSDILADAGVTTDSINAAASKPDDGLTVLKGDDSLKQQGQFVLDNQPLGTADGFRNVSAIWLPKTLTYEQGLAQIEADKAKTHDILATVTEMVPTVNDKGEFAFLHRPTETFYVPTAHAVKQAGHWADTGTWYVENMLVNPTDYKGQEKYKRDRQDAETLAKVFQNGFRRLDASKKFFWRTREDGTLRAMLTERFAQLDNRWFVDVLAKLIPGGRLSHWKGDGDTIYGNILIPDTIRAESDSDYGAMLSIGNSEIGIRRASSVPSIFRAICMNGCIWGQKKGQGIRQVHRGRINKDTFALEIKQNLDKQIPLLPQGIDMLLKTKVYAWDGASAKPVIGVFAQEYKLGKRQASDVLKAWNVEAGVTPDLSNTLFGVINSFTRAAQEQEENANWVKFDEIGGDLLSLDKDAFDNMVSRAKTLKTDEVEEIFA